MMAQNMKTIEKLSRELFIEIDCNGFIKEISKNCINILGYSREELINQIINKFIMNELDISLLDESNENVIDEIIFKSKNGNKLYMNVNFKVSKEDNKITSIFLLMIDVTRQKEKEMKNNQILKIFKNSRDFIYSLRIKPKLEIVYTSQGVYDMLGYTPEEYYGNPELLLQILHSEDNYIVDNILNNKIDFGKPIVVRNMHKNGHYIWTENYATPIYDEYGDLIGFEGTVRNIQDRKELEEKLLYLSYHDALTGLYNRGYFEKVKEKLDNDEDTAFGIIIIDLDNLKITNDTFGHDVGDQLIKITSSLIKNVVEENDTIARFGGDEFIVLLENVDYESIENTVNELDLIIKKYNHNNHLPLVKASIGFAHSETSIGKVEKVFRLADRNMYRDKGKKIKEGC